MAPIQSVQAAWLDEDLECIGVNNCNPETCTDTRASETSNSQDFSHNNDTTITITITSTSTNPMTVTAPFTCAATASKVETGILGPVIPTGTD